MNSFQPKKTTFHFSLTSTMGSALYKFRFANIQHLNIITNISNIYLIDAKGHYTEGAELIYETQGFQLTQSTGGGMGTFILTQIIIKIYIKI